MLGGGGRVLDIRVCKVGCWVGEGGYLMYVCVVGCWVGEGGYLMYVCKVGCWVGEGGYLMCVCVRWDVGWGREGT